MDNKFAKGLLIGGLLAAGAWVGLTSTKKGKQLTEDLQKDLKNITKELKKKLEDLNGNVELTFGIDSLFSDLPSNEEDFRIFQFSFVNPISIRADIS